MSTARALSVESSPSGRVSSPENEIRPSWRHSTDDRQNLPRLSTNNGGTLREQFLSHAKGISRQIEESWQNMNRWQRVGAVAAAIGAIAVGLTVMVFTGKLFIWLEPVAEKWEKSALAYFVVWLCVFVVSFPPLIGWSTLGTVSGYIFGLWKG